MFNQDKRPGERIFYYVTFKSNTFVFSFHDDNTYINFNQIGSNYSNSHLVKR